MKKDEYGNSVVSWNLAIGCIIAIIAMRVYESWSQSHLGDFDFLLYGAVIFIGRVLDIRSFAHPKKDNRCFDVPKFKIWRWTFWKRFEMRNRNLNRVAAYAFFGVAIFGVNSNLWWVETLHLFFTALGIISATASMIYYYPKGKQRFWAKVFGSLGIIGFLIGFATPLYSIADGEGIVALPIAVWLVLTTKKEK